MHENYEENQEHEELSMVKPGGLLDAVRKDKFIEYLCDEWPVNTEQHKRMEMEGEVQDQSNDPEYPWKQKLIKF